MKSLKTALLATAGVLIASTAHATFVGDQVDIHLGAPGVIPTLLNQPGTLVTDPGAEASHTINATFRADLGPTTLTLEYDVPTFNSPVGANIVWTITDMDLQGGLIGDITGISLSSGDGTKVANTGFTANSVMVEFTNFSTTPSDGTLSWVFDIDNNAPPPPPPGPTVPVPAALPLMAAGIGALGLMARRRQK